MDQNPTDDKFREMRNWAFENQNMAFSRCLEPTMQCQKKAIRAHSIQNSRILDNLAENGHVVMLAHRDEANGPKIEWGLAGRNSATTFTGLCSEHDQKIFSAIDNERLDPTNKQHLFLLAYRSLYKGLHATYEAVIKIQAAYQQRVKLEIDPKEQPSVAGMLAVEKMFAAWDTWKYKVDSDEAFFSKNYDSICHDSLVIRTHLKFVSAG